jgi:hypothetical protein
MNKELKGAAIAAAVAALLIAPGAFAGSGYGEKSKSTGSKTEATTIHCDGVNDCKGKGDCKSAKGECKGTNSCQGKGFVTMTQEECDAKRASMDES